MLCVRFVGSSGHGGNTERNVYFSLIFYDLHTFLSNCLRPSRHRAQMCVPSALPLFRIGSRLHGQLFPSRLPALRGHTLSLVGRTLHTKSITKCNEKQNGTPANFENAPKFSCICLAVFPTVMKNKTECPTIFKNAPKFFCICVAFFSK